MFVTVVCEQLKKAPLCKGRLSNVASDKGLRDCSKKYLQSLRRGLHRATSLYTREAEVRTRLQGKQIKRLLLEEKLSSAACGRD